ncbi:MAG: helix-turn-helix domain-containing protein [Clostridia bacterium]|jgi:excisionase family DNA binding protein|nr:helix-turn-helix domain-containing protein [Clostridia bacterium]MBT7122893.1 helix-turn-helix domain-containing protein [Clostridia bacterium]
MQEIYYSVDKISELLDMHPKTIQRYIREGKLRATKVGKSWRVSGHDLSAFMETGAKPCKSIPAAARISVSAVVDINVHDMDEAMNISNMLTASLNAKPAEYGKSSMSAQFLDSENKLRVMLWGRPVFMEAMMGFLTGYIND